MKVASKYTILDDGRVSIDGAVLHLSTWTTERLERPADGKSVSVRDAFDRLSQEGSLRHLVVGVIGPREATEAQATSAFAVGGQLGGFSITLLCGGGSGVMEAACRGCREQGGLPIGLLPGSAPHEANQFVGVPLPTGIGEGRNMIIAKASRVLIAVGTSYGTLSEVAYGLHFGKTVIGIDGAAEVKGLIRASGPKDAVDVALDALARSARAMAGS
jgi:uncharacterized protein (TIGR00725 family)